MSKRSVPSGRKTPCLVAVLVCMAWPDAASAQDLEPRRWTHLPVGTNVVGLTYGYTDGRVGFDPLLELQDVEADFHTAVASYAHVFDCFGKTGRLDLILPYRSAHWDGLQSGVPASAERAGLADPWLRFSVDLAGAPALKGEEYLKYRAANPISTVVGVAVAVLLPLGEYQADKLLNLGQNRFIIRPQVGVLHTRGSWSYELTGSVFFFTENDDFFGGNEREQDPLFACQAHVVHTFSKRWWASLSAGYSRGGESAVNGQPRNDERGDLLSAVSLGLPLGDRQAVKLVYLRGDTQEPVGSDTDNLVLSWTLQF